MVRNFQIGNSTNAHAIMFDPKSKKSSPEKRTFSVKNVCHLLGEDMAIALAVPCDALTEPLRRSVRNLRKEDTTRRFRQSIEPLARVIVIHHPFLTVAHRARSHTAPPSPVARPRLRPSAKMFQRHTTERSSHRCPRPPPHLSRSSARHRRHTSPLARHRAVPWLDAAFLARARINRSRAR